MIKLSTIYSTLKRNWQSYNQIVLLSTFVKNINYKLILFNESPLSNNNKAFYNGKLNQILTIFWDNRQKMIRLTDNQPEEFWVASLLKNEVITLLIGL